jgi:hypothetical protein
MADATSIESLPKNNNVTLMTSEKPVNVKVGNARAPPAPMGAMETMSAMSGSPPAELSTKAINQIVSGLQQASQSGLTQLPSRDIPMSTQQLTQDVQIKPNYVPAANNKDYIEQHDNYQSLLNKKKSESKQQDRLDSLYEELQIPLLVMVLFFLFQMPYVSKLLLKRFPSLFLRDGNPAFGGHLLKTALFGIAFYIILRGIRYIGEM